MVRSVRTFEQWRDAARPLLAGGVAPDKIDWGDTWRLRNAAGQELPAAGPGVEDLPYSRQPRISAGLLRLLESLAMYRSPGRWEFMYRLTWRTMTENPQLLEDAADPDVHTATLWERSVNRDVHKMHAFVRFREDTTAPHGSGVGDPPEEKAYFAWFEPEHEILRRGAGFFVERFRNMRWTIATPDGAAIWDLRHLVFIDAPQTDSGPREDAAEDLWGIYYRSICNTARLNPTAMQREMPQRYWKHLPEAASIAALLRAGAAGVADRQRTVSRMANTVNGPADSAATDSLQACQRCDLWRQATQAVPGEGAASARIMLVGEQPGDEEDLRGHPFVGPAGKVLDAALAAAGLLRPDLYVTNAVKHFKWEPRGKRRLHKKPGVGEINACNFWLQQEIESVAPAVIVALGASALRALTGATLSIDGARRQELYHSGGARILATYHPSAVLRADGVRMEELRDHLEGDLRRAREMAPSVP